MNRYSAGMENQFLNTHWWKWPGLVVVGLVTFSVKHIEWLLISGLVVLAGVQYYLRPQSQSLLQMQESSYIKVLISDDPDSQYMFNRRHYGFEYELLAKFAQEQGLEIKLEVVPFAELFSLLENGQGDMAVGGILLNPYVTRVSQPTISWYQAKTTVVYSGGENKPKNLYELGKEPILASARYYAIEGFNVLNLVDDHRSEYQLLTAVNQKQEQYVLTVDYRAINAKHYLPYLNRSFILPSKVNLVWSLPKRFDPALLDQLNQFLQRSLDEGLPTELAQAYFALPKRLSAYDAQTLHKKIESDLPQYEAAFRKAARKAGIDWTLLAAISYQESHWSNSATSPTGVRGIMQLTQATADYLGVKDRMDLSESIDAAAKYIRILSNRFPKEIKEPERTWFTLAAYNMGYKHVKNAYRKVKKQGQDATDWAVVSEVLPELYGEPFSNGIQGQRYVERVQIFTDILRFYDSHQRGKTNVLNAKLFDDKQHNDKELDAKALNASTLNGANSKAPVSLAGG